MYPYIGGLVFLFYLKTVITPKKTGGGVRRKAKYNVGGPYRDKVSMPGSKSLPKVPQRGLGGTAQERVQQMKHGGSMCRGLPGGPNEFPM